MLVTLRAYATHAFTATGAAVGLLALLAAADGDWVRMFLWLGVALVIDGTDGPLARRYDARANAPIIDGALLDLVVDYLTYVFVPVFALLRAGLLPGRVGLLVALAVSFGSALYFADTRMKTPDRSFSGFPACWNMVALVVFVLEPSPVVVVVLLLALTVLMFVPVKFVHPVRTRRWRSVTLPAALLWIALAGAAIGVGAAAPGWVGTALLATSLYLLVAGAAQQAVTVVAPSDVEAVRPRRSHPRS
jgi:phosphatidylcholine synthase